jgi:hypothetical protein
MSNINMKKIYLLRKMEFMKLVINDKINFLFIVYLLLFNMKLVS